MRVYAIGDIHGQLGMLRTAHQRIADDKARVKDPDATVVHVGDLVDRGPDSKGVVQELMDGIEGGEPWVVLKGNHDRLFEYFIRDGKDTDGVLREGLTWHDNPLGGKDTLRSYGVERSALERASRFHSRAVEAVPEAHLRFIEARPTSHRIGNLFFAHAGIRPGVPLDEQEEDDLVWIRNEFLSSDEKHPALIVHGHTVVQEATHYGNRINLDSGAGYGDPITAAVIEGTQAWVLGHDGRRPMAEGNPHDLW